MVKAVFVAYSNPNSIDDETEFNRWYDLEHLPAVCSVEGVSGARRFEIATQQVHGAHADGHRYLALYEIDSPNPQAVVDEIKRKSTDGTFVMSRAMNMTHHRPVTTLYIEHPPS